jgi:flagellar assembly protein FliH
MLHRPAQPVSRFTFDRAFDGGAKDAAAQIAERAAEQLAAAAAQAERDGFARGYAQAQAEIEAATLAAVGQLCAAMGDALGDLDQVRRRLIADSATVAGRIGSVLAGSLIERFPAERVTALVDELLPSVIEENRLVIRVADALLDSVRSPIEQLAQAQGFAGRLIFLADPALGSGDVRIEWARGGVEALSTEADTRITRHIAAFAGNILAGGEES